MEVLIAELGLVLQSPYPLLGEIDQAQKKQENFNIKDWKARI